MSNPLFDRFFPARPGLGSALGLAACMIAARCGAEPSRELVLGMSTALSGPTAKLGINMRSGVEAAFAEANRAGGVSGRTIRLISLDDGYEPARAAPNMARLIDQDKVIGIIGNVGTPTAVVAIPIARQAGTVFFGAFSGAGVLRKSPPDKCVINYRSSYAEETRAIVDALIDHAHLKPDEIAFFTQRDAYGDAGYGGGIAALKQRGLVSEAGVAHGRYERNTVAVEEAVAELLAAPKPPRAVIMVGTAKPSAAFVRICRRSGLNVPMVSVSFAGASETAELLGAEAHGVYFARVVPPLDPALPLVRDFFAAFPDPATRKSTSLLEGYIVGRIACLAVAKVQGEPTRGALVAAFESLGAFDLGLGAPLRLSVDEHQACHRVWASRLEDGGVLAMEWSELPALVEPPTRAEVRAP
jgi:branched-chain amino acid transport system substrate-binding protein